MCWIMTTCPMAHFRVMFASFSKRAWKVALKLFKRYTCNNNSFFFLIISPLFVQGLYRPTHIFWSIPMPRSLRIQRNVNQCLRSAVLLAKPTGRGKCNHSEKGSELRWWLHTFMYPSAKRWCCHELNLINLYLPLQHSKPLHRFGLISVCILGYKRVFSVQRPSLCKRCVVRDTIKPTNSTTANVAEVFCITLNLWMEYKPVCRAEWTDIDSRNNLQICLRIFIIIKLVNT